MKIAMYDLEGNFLEILEGDTYQDIISLLPVKSGITNTASIQQAVRGEQNFCKRYQFRQIFTKKPLEKIGSCIDLKETKELPVNKYYKDKYICTYKNIKEASDKNNTSHANIARCAKNSKGTAGGFEWRYAK